MLYVIHTLVRRPRRSYFVLQQRFIFRRKFSQSENSVSASFRGSRCLAMEYMHTQRERTIRQRPNEC